MEALGAAASIAGLVSLAIEIPKLIDTAISIQSAPEEAAQLSKTVDALVATLQKLEVFLKSNEAQDMQMANDSALTVSISACQTRILDLSKSLRAQITPVSASSSVNPMSKVKSAIRRFRWPLEKAECLSVITELHAMESTFEFCLVMKNCQQMSRAHKEVISHFKIQSQVLNEMSASFPEQAEHARSMLLKLETIQLCIEKNVQQFDSIRIGVETLQEMNRDFAGYQADRLHGQALEWLSPLDTSLRHEEIGTDRLPETCRWIINDADFISWCQTAPSEDYSGVSCWIGDPGQGKTYTMSRIVEHLQTSYPNESGAYVTYLYCDYQRTSKYSVTSLVGALIRQLLGQFETLPEDIVELVRHSRLKLRRPNAKMDELVKILALLASRIKRLFICIDALDENSCAEEFVAACQQLPLAKSFFFIGRHSILQNLKGSYPSVSFRSIEPQNDDINAVVAAKLATDAMRDPDLMPDDLRATIQSSITRVADGMFLLATLHLMLVLSRNTIYQRLLALEDLPTTLPSAFDQTLTRIQEHTNASQAFRILALIHRFGPLSFELLRHTLAIEPSHTQFHQDNLPSRHTMLDCCMGLVRVNASRGTSGRRDMVALAHETLSTYFNSKQHVLEDALIEIAGSFIAMLSFPVLPRLRYVQLFVERSWVPLLYDLKSPTSALSDKIWEYIVELNKKINDGTHHGLPMHVRGLLSESDSTISLHQKAIGQSLLHTTCMLDLDGLSLIKERILNSSNRECGSHIGSFDGFGLTPMGWILFPSYPLQDYPGSQNSVDTMSLERKLLRAESLMSMYPRTEPVRSLWDATTMVKCQKSARGRHIPLHFFTAVPILWFLSNYSFDPKGMQRCIEALGQYWNVNLWSAVGNTYRETTLLTTLDLQRTSDNKFSMIYIRSRELDQFRGLYRSDGFELSCQDTDPSRSLTLPSPSEVSLSDGPDDYRNILIVFERDKDIQTPSLALSSTSELEMDYFKTREDVIIHDINPFPNVDGHVLSLSAETILHFGAFNDHAKIVSFALSKLKLDQNFRDPDENTALEISQRRENRFVRIPRSLAGANLEVQGPDRSYLLHYCVYRREYYLASDLLKSHIDIDLQDGWGRTALHYAATVRAEKMVHMLLERGADLDIADAAGKTALHHATKCGDINSIDLLIKRGAGLNVADSFGRTALHYAVESGSRQTVEFLMKKKPDANIIDSDGRTPLHLAIIRRDLPTCELFFNSRNVITFTPGNLELAWHLALRSGGEFAMRLLCSVRSTPLRLPGNGHLHSSTALAHSNRIFNIITKTKESSKWTANDLEFLMRLVNDSNNLSASTRGVAISGNTGSKIYDWSTAIRSAIESRADSVAAYLLRTFSVDVDHLQNDGETALHLAVIYDACQVFQLLLNNEKVDTMAVNSQGYTALHLTLVHRRLNFLQMMLNSPRIDIDVGQEVQGSGATALHLAIRHDLIDAVPLLLSCPQINLDKLDGSGRTVLHHAVLKQNVTLVKSLLGCPTLTPTIPSRDGRTALAYAALCAGEEMVALLLETSRFDLDLKDKYGKTAVDWARQNSVPRVFEMIEAARLSTLTFW